MAYVEERRKTENVEEIHKKQTPSHHAPNAKAERAKKEKPTPEAMKRYNQKKKERDMIMLVNANFKAGDLYMTLTYKADRRPETEERAKKNLKNFRDCIKRRLKKRGKELKAIWCTEIGVRGAVHHHMLCNDTDVKALTKAWERYGGHVHFQFTYGKDLSRLAGYLCKSDTKLGIHSYNRTKNLKQPKISRRKISAGNWQKEPRVPQGWMLDRESFESGTNPYTGYDYQYYRLIRLE